MNEPAIKQVSDTAFMAAAYRAMETDHPRALFHDPLAAKLAGEQGRKIIDSLPKQALIGGWTVVIRTRIIDDFIQAAIAEGVDTVLNLGAELDTRPYRMQLPRSPLDRGGLPARHRAQGESSVGRNATMPPGAGRARSCRR